jgi:predicted enzyme related to lactoylglutathione lyase
MDKVEHFEIPYDQPERATKFYSQAFGWQIQAMPEMQYHMVTTTPVGPDFRPTEPGAINGGMFKREAQLKSPTLVVGVQEIKAAVERVKAAGGKIIQEPKKVGEMGIVAYFQDPEGNVLGLWQNLAG